MTREVAGSSPAAPVVSRAYHIHIDSREKLPLIFPEYLALLGPSGQTERVKLITSVATLETGDYSLAVDPMVLAIERKKSLRELCGNLVSPTGRARFIRELERIRTGFRFGGILLLEGSPLSLTRECPSSIQPHEPRDLLLSLLLSYPTIRLWMGPMDSPSARRAAGEWVAAALIRCHLTRGESNAHFSSPQQCVPPAEVGAGPGAGSVGGTPDCPDP